MRAEDIPRSALKSSLQQVQQNGEGSGQAEGAKAEDGEKGWEACIMSEKQPIFFKSESNEWATPKDFYNRLNYEFHFNFDPCPFGGEQDGTAPLFCSWTGKRVFCNPPYTDIPKFLDRARDAEVAVFLIPARTDTKWFHGLILPFAKEIRSVKGRLKFGDGRGPAPFPSMVVIF